MKSTSQANDVHAVQRHSIAHQVDVLYRALRCLSGVPMTKNMVESGDSGRDNWMKGLRRRHTIVHERQRRPISQGPRWRQTTTGMRCYTTPLRISWTFHIGHHIACLPFPAREIVFREREVWSTRYTSFCLPLNTLNTSRVT